MTTDTDIVVTRHFNAPRSLVYQAWVDPAKLAKWWGPHTFTASADMDVKQGGRYRWVMHGEDGSENPVVGEFIEIIPNERLMMTMKLEGHTVEFQAELRKGYEAEGGDPSDGVEPKIIMTVTFEEAKDDSDHTLLTVSQTLPNTPWRDTFLKLGSKEGWAQSFEKLAAIL